MKTVDKNTIFLLLGVALTGCAADPPIAEVRLVAKAFDNLSAASQPLLDDHALAERAQGISSAVVRAQMRAATPNVKDSSLALPAVLSGRCPDIILMGDGKAGTPAVQNGFCTDDSYYYSALVDPPATSAFRRSLAAVGDYTQLLLILAEGRNVDAAKSQLQVLAGNVGVALAVVGAGVPAPVLQGALNALDPLISIAAKDANLAELKRVVRDESPKVDAVIAALRNTAPELFRTLTQAPLARFNTQGLTNPQLAQADAGRIEGYRVAVSNYIVLLDQYRSLLRDVVVAYDKPRDAATLASFADRSAQLSANADAWRRTLAIVHTGLQ